MKETFQKYRDIVLAVAMVAGVAGAAYEGGSFLVTVAKWPVMVGLFVGLAFMLGNEGGHSFKRVIRDRVWRVIKPIVDFIKSKFPWLRS